MLTTDGFVGLLDGSVLWMVEAVVAGGVDHGCTTTQAVDVFRSLRYYTVGEILVRAHSAVRRPAAASVDGFLAGVDAARTPSLAANGDRWPALAARDTYPDGVRALIDGLLARATSTPRP